MRHTLAIIIPAYKVDFFERTLTSIAEQTCMDFVLYIGDDDSAHPLKDIVMQYAGRIEIVYHRFESNLGSNSLTLQWERCIALSVHEPLIWLFSDDDIMPNDAVERILKAVEESGADDCFFRFPLSVIDNNDQVIACNPPLTEVKISGFQFLLDKMNGKIHSAACEYVFSRNLYEHLGRIVAFPLAWCSDDATWIKFAGDKGIVALMGKSVHWRNVDGCNISNLSCYNAEKIMATSLFIDWLVKYFGKRLNNRLFYKALRNYIRTILVCSLHRQYTNRQLLVLCQAVGRINSGLALWVYLKSAKLTWLICAIAFYNGCHLL